jgi:hypothetical protein
LWCGKCFALFISFFICTFSASLFNAQLLSAQSIPTVDVQKKFENGKASLAGKWALNWGEWTSLADIASSEGNFKIVQLPNFVSALVDDKTFNEYRFGTYILKLNNLSITFNEPAIRMGNVNVCLAGMARLMCASLSWLIRHCSVTWPVESSRVNCDWFTCCILKYSVLFISP